MFEQLLLADRPSLIEHHILEYPDFLSREGQSLLAYSRPTRLCVESEISAGQQHIVLRKTPEREAANPRRKLFEMKRLREVIVRARVKARHLLGNLAARRQDEHLGLAVNFPQCPKHCHAIRAGKVQVEHDKIEVLDGKQVERFPPIMAAVDAVRKAPQAARDRIAQRPLVFNNQNAHAGLLA